MWMRLPHLCIEVQASRSQAALVQNDLHGQRRILDVHGELVTTHAHTHTHTHTGVNLDVCTLKYALALFGAVVPDQCPIPTAGRRCWHPRCLACQRSMPSTDHGSGRGPQASCGWAQHSPGHMPSYSMRHLRVTDPSIPPQRRTKRTLKSCSRLNWRRNPITVWAS